MIENYITEEEMHPNRRLPDNYEDCNELTAWDYWEEDYYQENKEYERN